MNHNSNNSNPLLCDPIEGICGVPENVIKENSIPVAAEKQIKVIYFTDPICSSCWGIEPQLRKLKLEYGDLIEFEYRMGGLLPDWSYNSGGISKPSDVAHHWDEVSIHYDMPIDGDVWLEDPLDSSYPPSIAFKAAQMQDNDKALIFLRLIREMVFLQKKNITKLEHIAMAASNAGLDAEQFKSDFEKNAKSLFEADLKLAREYGVRGFPTMFFMNQSGQREVVYGSKPYQAFETAIQKISPDAVKSTYPKDWQFLFKKFGSLTAREFSELADMARKDTESYLNTLCESGSLTKFKTKNGDIWAIK